jgi:hypothetical protein
VRQSGTSAPRFAFVLAYVVVAEKDVEIFRNPEPVEDRSREERLRALLSGDIFEARDDAGNPLTCLVEGIDETGIFAHVIATQVALRFDRGTGEILPNNRGYAGAILSIEPLPAYTHNTLLSLDRRYRLAERSPESTRLRRTEIDALTSIRAHFDAHPV